ncbi:ATP-binding protein [Pseudoponticoccus marisrubri]|uniref:histidine kinase n=1 Tax=Pseudoponticoccus marisrubri TaxID=1685382 RepID=A0A0W7WM37_9RHOB|nr:ATP-binding protein [Pseudoponticoccus marisrubri]KUF11643.1 PAS domain-containing sensor histidine kinase [Pseudoponticoccus marisrubri]
MTAVTAEMVEAIPMPAVVIRHDERIEAANAAARTLLGPNIGGRHFITALRQPSLLDTIESCLRDRASRSTTYLTNDGRQDTTFRVTAGPVTLDSGPAALVCFEDTTHVARSGQIRRDFVANVSHELRTPLTALIGFIETLKGPARNDPVGQARFLDVMEQEAHRMNRLVADLLSLSRVEAEERVRPTDRLDLAALLRDTVHGVAPLAAEAGSEIVTELPEGRVSVPGDADQLRQVFTNLVENAIKYSGAGARITVSLSAPEFQPRLRASGVVASVRDTGPGIDPIHIPRLTERFYRVDDHRSREMGGTGLGLAIVKHIVNRHRGRMRIESEIGHGMCVTLLLPSS